MNKETRRELQGIYQDVAGNLRGVSGADQRFEAPLAESNITGTNMKSQSLCGKMHGGFGGGE
jgi:adenylylsulfate kinase-like enzyme